MECKLIEEADASPETREIYLEIKNTLGIPNLPNWVKALGAYPNLLKANWEKAKNTIVEGTIPPLLKELLIFKVSVMNSSPYCSACHAHSALQLDKSLDYEDLVKLSQGEMLNQLPEPYQVALEIVPRVTKDPSSLTETDMKRLKDQGFSENEIMELFAQGDIALMFNAITMLYNVPLDEGYRPILDETHTKAA